MNNISITTWNRLEPKQRSSDYNRGLQASIHDPLWMLARQWQVGEFEGEDAASPIKIEVKADYTTLTRFATNHSSQGKAYNPGELPLEVQVEKEPIDFSTLDGRLRAELGNEFLKLLAANTEYNEYREVLKEIAGFKNNSELYKHHLLQKSIDASKLITLDINEVYAQLTNQDATIQREFQREWEEWRKWATKTIFGVESTSAWSSDRQEYAFSVAAPNIDPLDNAQEILLTSTQYRGGHLDWPSFTIEPTKSIGASTDPLPAMNSLEFELLPMPLEIPGMPSQRWWEFEDANVNMGNLETAPEDISRMLLAHFALLSGNDWFAIPLELPVGSITKISQLQVTNTFGEVLNIEHSSSDALRNIDNITGKESPWRMFHISPEPDSNSVDSLLPFLFLPPALGPSLHSEPLEELRFMRDEMINAAWSIERTVQNKTTGALLDRHERYQSLKPGFEQESTSSDTTGSLKYILTNDVPDYWVPLLPLQNIHGEASDKLQVGTFHGKLEQSTSELLGEISKELKESGVYDEEIPREGIFVYRQFQFARWHDGSSYLWISRRKTVGSGEGASNLKFDSI